MNTIGRADEAWQAKRHETQTGHFFFQRGFGAMDTKQTLIDLLRPPKRQWYGGPTLLGILRGVSYETAAYTPPGLKNSMWRLLLHLAYSRYVVTRKLTKQPAKGGFPRSGGYWPALPSERSAATWKDDIALLKTETEKLIEAISDFDDAQWHCQAVKTFTYYELAIGVPTHDLYHLGQMQLIKKLASAALT